MSIVFDYAGISSRMPRKPAENVPSEMFEYSAIDWGAVEVTHHQPSFESPAGSGFTVAADLKTGRAYYYRRISDSAYLVHWYPDTKQRSSFMAPKGFSFVSQP